MIMNSRIITMVILMLPAITIFSQDATKLADDSTPNSLLKSKLAFQYDAGYNFANRSVIPVVFSLKYHFSDKRALRLSVGMNLNEHGFGHGHPEGRPLNDTVHFNSHFDGHNGNIENLNISLNYMLYPAPKKVINLFFGLGPRFGIGETHFKGAENFEPDSSKGRNSTSWSIALAGVVGLEWFATRSFSIFTEYDVAAGYQKRNYWDADYNPAAGTYTLTEVKSSEFRLTDLSARLGLSIYFDKPF